MDVGMEKEKAMNPALKALGAQIVRLLRRWSWWKVAFVIITYLLLTFLAFRGFIAVIVATARGASEGNFESVAWKITVALFLGLVVTVLLGLILIIDEVRNWWLKILGVLGIAAGTGFLWWKMSPMFTIHPTLLTFFGAGLLVGGVTGAFLVFAPAPNKWLNWVMALAMAMAITALAGLGFLRAGEKAEEVYDRRSGSVRTDDRVYVINEQRTLADGESSRVYDTEPPPGSPVSWHTVLTLQSGCAIRTINGRVLPKNCAKGPITGDEPPTTLQIRAVGGPTTYHIRTWEVP